MKTTATASVKQIGEWIFVQSPYSASFLEEFKEAIPWKERVWERPIWKVKPSHLQTVRDLLQKYAQIEHWEVLDYTAKPREQVEDQKESVEKGNLDRHVAAVLAVLPKLPKRALRLVEWSSEYATFELNVFLDDKDLFKELAQASLESYRPTILYGGSHKRNFKQTFIIASDERLMRGVCAYAGIIPLNSHYGSNVEYLLVRDLPLERLYANGVAHFTGSDESVWIGIPFLETDVDLSWSRTSWEVTIFDKTIYLIFEREQAVRRLINLPEYEYLNPGGGNIAVASSSPSRVAAFVTFSHSEAWFHAWGNALVGSEQVSPTLSFQPRWFVTQWEHPADTLLAHLSWRRSGCPEMAALLDWNEGDVEYYRQRVRLLKEQAVERVLAEMKARACEIALPKLETLTIKELSELATKHEIDVKKSWGKAKIVSILAASQVACEDSIGLAKRLEQK